jgi:hypothetical protein
MLFQVEHKRFNRFKSNSGFMERPVLRFRKPLCIQSSHTAGSRTGNGLTANMILHITSGKPTRHIGQCGHALVA